MAKKSLIARQKKREKLVEKFAKLRLELKENKDYEALQKIPKNASPVRLHNRCSLTGRPRGYVRDYGISRLMFRDLANFGFIPGIKKASW